MIEKSSQRFIFKNLKKVLLNKHQNDLQDHQTRTYRHRSEVAKVRMMVMMMVIMPLDLRSFRSEFSGPSSSSSS